MKGEVHANLVLYKKRPIPGDSYRQIAVVEWDQFEVQILEGDVIQPDPNFKASSEGAEVYFYPDLKSALDNAEAEFETSIKSGWIPYKR
jgi:hypothetical protein